jgi:hypothetical protein
MKQVLTPVLLSALLFAPLSLAAEEKKTDTIPSEKPSKPTPSPIGRFAPDFCDFEITFPEAPFRTSKCPENGGACYDLYSYTMVFDLRTTVDVSVSCTPSTPEQFSRYNDAVIRAALAGMVDERRLDDYTTDVRDINQTRRGAITGTGKTGTQDKIYTAQLWIGPQSIFTVQAELIGDTHQGADQEFSAILRSIQIKQATPPPAPPPPAGSETN